MSTFEKIEKAVVEGYKKIEDTVVGKFQDISDSFVEKHLMKEGETLEEAKERIAKETAEKSIEASQNAGKR